MSAQVIIDFSEFLVIRDTFSAVKLRDGNASGGMRNPAKKSRNAKLPAARNKTNRKQSFCESK